jgi:KDO2-lipid IV(A) lauroyltransferase
VPAFVVRKPDNTHKLVFEKPIDVTQKGATEEDVKRYTQAWTGILEKYVRKYPEQWVWVHRRWKTRKT